MAELKTKKTDESVIDFLNTVDDEKKRKDAFVILHMMKDATALEPKMWGSAIIGFGTYHYKYESGHEGDMCMIGFSPRKQNLTLYLMMGEQKIQELLKELGKHTTGKSCLYIKKLEDVNKAVLRQLIKISFGAAMKTLAAG